MNKIKEVRSELAEEEGQQSERDNGA